ncbi:UPF0149 family protein [Gallaecimonas sp. GXIMD4217]|uniref:UPF0149 family protein n=1 Tax=Gallaecimonas sp. GXIMD4217 TaxID=3131927 RepID=UPI00311B36A3
MLVFNCTKAATEFLTKTVKGIKQCPVDKAERKEFDHDDAWLTNRKGEKPACFEHWILHVVTIHRRKCLIAMSRKQRYAMVFTGLKKGDWQAFISAFYERFINELIDLAVEFELVQEDESGTQGLLPRLMEVHGDFRFFERSDHSVNAHIKEVVWRFEDHVYEGNYWPEEPFELADFDAYVNRTLRGHKDKAGHLYPDRDFLCHYAPLLGAEPEQVAALLQDERGYLKRMLSSATGGPEASLEQDMFIRSLLNQDSPTTEELVFIDQVLALSISEQAVRNASELHGFLTAIVSAPKPIMPNMWLAAIWGQPDCEPDWHDRGQQECFLNLVMRMMSCIAIELTERPQDFALLPLLEDVNGEELESAKHWCYGYLWGAQLGHWPQMPEPGLAQFKLIEGYHEVESKPTSQNMAGRHQGIERLNVAARALHAFWLQQRQVAKV